MLLTLSELVAFINYVTLFSRLRSSLYLTTSAQPLHLLYIYARDTHAGTAPRHLVL